MSTSVVLKFQMIVAAIGLSGASGCAVAPEQDPPEEVGQAASALSGVLIKSYGGTILSNQTQFTNGQGFYHDLGVGSNYQCFLAGADGAISNGISISVSNASVPGITGGHWWIYVGVPAGSSNYPSAAGQSITGIATCAILDSAMGSPDMNVVNGTTYAVDGSNYFCGLAQVGTYGSNTNWVSDVDYEEVDKQSSTQWEAFNNLSAGHSQEGVNCAHTASNTVYGPFTLASTGSYRSTTFSVPSSALCFLTELAGPLATDGAYYGADLNLSGGSWILEVSNGASATAICVN